MKSKPHTDEQDRIYWRLPDGTVHREDGPAIVYSDGTEWYINGIRHRLDGPAVIWADGPNRWFINGHHVTFRIDRWAKEYDIDLDNLSEEDKFMIRLHWENYNGK